MIMSKTPRKRSKSGIRRASASDLPRVRSFIQVNIPISETEIEVFDSLIESLDAAVANDNVLDAGAG
jgi:hypothetical protein